MTTVSGTANGHSRVSEKLSSLEIFTGAGGLAIGAHGAGFQHEVLVEWNKSACDTLRRNCFAESLPGVRNWNVVEDDIRKMDFGQFGGLDLVAGGPPCQPFSIGGQHRGVDDERNMIPEFIRAIREIKPRAFVFENVKGLSRQTFRNYFSYIQLQLAYPSILRKNAERWEEHLSRLEDIHTQGPHDGLTYRVVTRLLNAADYGVPQGRERVFIVGFRSDLGVDWHFPEATHNEERLLYDQWVTGDYWERHDVGMPKDVPDRLVPRISKLRALFVPPGLPWATVRDAIGDLPDPETCNANDISGHRYQPGARAYPGHTGSPLDGLSKTLKAGVHGVPGGENMIAFGGGEVRYFTVREAARLQTFPDSWEFLGSWSEAMRQLGNAVPVDLAKVVLASVAKRLRDC